MRKFLGKIGSTNYYMVDSGMGGFLNPPDHPEHSYSIEGCRGGHVVEMMSLSSCLDDYYRGGVRGAVKAKLKQWEQNRPAVPPHEWVVKVYKYFRHCYSKDGINRGVDDCVTYGKFWDNAEQEQNENPYHHLGFMFVKSFYPVHEPDVELIKNPESKETI